MSDLIAWKQAKEGVPRYPGRNDLPGLLNEVWDDLEPIDKPGALMDAWTMAEWPLRLVDWSDWQSMFDEVTGGLGENHIAWTGERYTVEPSLSLPSFQTLYRGCVKGHEEGMSWTTHKPTAEWFAKRFDHIFGRPVILTLDVPSDWVYAVAHAEAGRDEREVIIDPAFFETLEPETTYKTEEFRMEASDA